MRKILRLVKIFSIGLLFFVCSNHRAQQNDGDSFKSVKIGEQTWTTENLNVDKFRNGDFIPEAKTNEEWISAGLYGKPAWCYYNNNPENGKKYGKLYNFYAVDDKRGLAPKGWHIPTIEEFQTLAAIFNHDSNALKAIGEGILGGKGSNKSGFSALLVGIRFSNGNFISLSRTANFHIKSILIALSMNIFGNSDKIKFSDMDKSIGNSVRCIKD